MTCVGFLDSCNPNKQKHFFCQECEKNLCDSKRLNLNLDDSTLLLSGGEVPHSRASSRHRSSMYSLLYQGLPQHQNYTFGSPLPQPYPHHLPRETTTTVTPQSHVQPLFLPPCPKLQVKPPAPPARIGR